MRAAVEHGRRWSRALGRGMADLVFPPRCAGCDAELAAPVAGPLLCTKCLTAIVSRDVPRCDRCGARIFAADGPDDCRECARFELRFDAAVALGNYDGLMRQFVLRMKQQQHEALTLALAGLVWREYAQAITAWKCDLVVPVPMHWWRRVWRGTNSPDLLATRLAEDLRVDCLPRSVTRSRATQPQSELALGERFHNVRGAFRLRRGYDVRGARVLLVDDILTTGATASEVARVLKRSGALRVSVVVLARTQQPA
jgi:ComF family protein